MHTDETLTKHLQQFSEIEKIPLQIYNPGQDKDLVVRKLVWALLEDFSLGRTPEGTEITGTVKEALDNAKRAFFE